MGKANSQKKQLNTKVFNKSNSSKNDTNKLKDKYLETFSKFGFIFAIYTSFRCKRTGTWIWIIIYKIIFYIITSIYFLSQRWDLGTLKLIILLLVWVFILNLPNVYVGYNAKDMLYSTWKFKSIKEMYEHEKHKERISTFLIFLSPFLKIFILWVFCYWVLFALFALGWGRRN